jgi:Uma2 family endonuclease
MGWLATYEAATPGVEAGTNCTARLDLGSEPQPDGLLLIAPECGGQATISASDFIEAAPELVVEVAASSVDYDLGTKLNAYRRNRVREYIVWRVLDGAIDWFVLRGELLERLNAGEDGIYRSEVFPGLWLDPGALLRGDLAAVLAMLQRGIATAEHAAYVARLKPGRP